MLYRCRLLDHYERLPIHKRQLSYPLPAVGRDPPTLPPGSAFKVVEDGGQQVA